MARDEHKSDLEIYRRLLTYVLPYWAAFLVSIVGFLIYSLSNVSFVMSCSSKVCIWDGSCNAS